MTLEELKVELNYLSMRNHSVEKMLDLERRNKRRYEFLIATKQFEEAEKVADQMLAWEKGKPLNGIADLEKKYEWAFNLLSPLDCRIAKLRFMKGLSYYDIGAEIGYTADAVKKRMNGRTIKNTYYAGIYDTLLAIMNGREG